MAKNHTITKRIRKENLTRLMDHVGQTKLAELTGLAPAYLYQMTRAEGSQARGVGDRTAAKVESALNLGPGALDSPDLIVTLPDGEIRVEVKAYGIRAVDGADGVDPSTDVMLSVCDIDVSAGNGVIVPEFVETKYRLPYQIDWLKRWDAAPEDILIARVRGDSMEPILYDGDKAVIHRGMQRIANDCTYMLIYPVDGHYEARIKRLFRLSDGRIRVVSNNPDKTTFPDELIDPSDISIVGRVIERMGSGGL